MKIQHEEKLEEILKPQKVKYDFLQDSEDEEVIAEIDYGALVHLQEKNLGQEVAQQVENFTEEKDSIIFYCKDCKEEKEVSRMPSPGKKKVKFMCNSCQGKNIIYGTLRGVKAYYERINK